MTEISSYEGVVPIEVGQEWALRVSIEKYFVGFLIMRIEGFENTCVSMEVVRAEHDGRECDLVAPVWHEALEEFGYNGKFYFANSRWSVWDDMFPCRK